MTGQARRIWVCVTGRHCCQRRPQEVLNALKQAVDRQGVGDKVEVLGGGCLGMCGYGPNALVIIGRSRIAYAGLCPGDADEIVAAHADGHKPIERLRLKRS